MSLKERTHTTTTITHSFNFRMSERAQFRVFLKRHFKKKIKNPTQYATGGDLGRIYPEGEGDLTSLGGPGPPRHLKFGKK